MKTISVRLNNMINMTIRSCIARIFWFSRCLFIDFNITSFTRNLLYILQWLSLLLLLNCFSILLFYVWLLSSYVWLFMMPLIGESCCASAEKRIKNMWDMIVLQKYPYINEKSIFRYFHDLLFISKHVHFWMSQQMK